MQTHRGSVPEHTDLWQSYCLKGVCVCVNICDRACMQSRLGVLV